MHIDFLLRTFEESSESNAIVWREREFTYEWLLDRVRHWLDRLEAASLPPASVVALEADFSPNAVAVLLALTERGALIVPILSSTNPLNRERMLTIAEIERSYRVDEIDEVREEMYARVCDHELYRVLRGRGNPGLVLFSSGSSGKPKAAVHDFTGSSTSSRRGGPRSRRSTSCSSTTGAA